MTEGVQGWKIGGGQKQRGGLGNERRQDLGARVYVRELGRLVSSPPVHSPLDAFPPTLDLWRFPGPYLSEALFQWLFISTNLPGERTSGTVGGA